MGRRPETPAHEALGKASVREEAGPARPLAGVRRRRLAEAPEHEGVEFLRPAPLVRGQGVLRELGVETGGRQVPADAQGAVSPPESAAYERLGAPRLGLQACLGEVVEHRVEGLTNFPAEAPLKLRAQLPAAVLAPGQEADAGLPERRGIRRSVGPAGDQ